MKRTNKTVALVLVLVLALTSVATAFAFQGKANTTGGKLNVWKYRENIGDNTKNSKVATVKNGADLGEMTNYDEKTKTWYSEKYEGYVRKVYVAEVKAPTAPEAGKEAKEFAGKANTTGGKLNVWENKDFTGEKILTVKNGEKLGTVITYSNKPYAEVYNEEDEFIGFVRKCYVAPAK